MQTTATRVRCTAHAAQCLANFHDGPGTNCRLDGLVGAAQLTVLNAHHAPACDHPRERDDAVRNGSNRFPDFGGQIDAPMPRQPCVLRSIKGADYPTGYRW